MWQKNYITDFGGRVPNWGFGESVLVDGGNVICAPGGGKATVVALAADTGSVVWQTPVAPVGQGNGYSSAVKATVAGVPMYVVLLGQSAGVVGVAADTGKLLWQYNKVGFGGVAQIAREPGGPGAELRIAVAGPVTSFALAALFGGAWHLVRGVPILAAPAIWLARINFAVAIFNLVPGYPLDGGRLLRAYFWGRSGDLRQATARAADWGAGIATGLMILGALQIFAGALIGGITALLLAPMSGEELRARGRERFDEISDDVREAYAARVAQLEGEIARLRAGKKSETA